MSIRSITILNHAIDYLQALARAEESPADWSALQDALAILFKAWRAA